MTVGCVPFCVVESAPFVAVAPFVEVVPFYLILVDEVELKWKLLEALEWVL